jgi:hypothetical protein
MLGGGGQFQNSKKVFQVEFVNFGHPLENFKNLFFFLDIFNYIGVPGPFRALSFQRAKTPTATSSMFWTNASILITVEITTVIESDAI